MSQANDELDQFRTTAGVSERKADLDVDHPLRNKFGDETQRQYDARQSGEKFVDLYDDHRAFLREFISNAETACIRRARWELKDNTDLDVAIDDLNADRALQLAEEHTDYEPQIDIIHNKSSRKPRLVIEDNGIGITKVEYEALCSVGFSASHGTGSDVGQFGIGFMSGFLSVGSDGVFRLYTKPYEGSRGEYKAYSTAEYLANFDYLPEKKETVGTRFEFPNFVGKADDIDMPSAVEQYTDALRVDVVYRDFNESGEETVHSEEYDATRLTEEYENAVVVDNEFFTAVMEPNRSDDIRTINVSMPIKRNTSSYTTNPSYDAYSKWHFRSKTERGPIVHCPSDESVVGLIPIEAAKYQMIDSEKKDNHIPWSDLPDDAVVMPKPASDRDSFVSNDTGFWEYVGECVYEESITTVADLISEYGKDITAYPDDTIEFVRDHVRHFKKDLLKQDGVNDDAVEFISLLRKSIRVVQPRKIRRINVNNSTSLATQKRTRSKRIAEIVDKHGSDVWFGTSINKKKAKLLNQRGDAIVWIKSSEIKDMVEEELDWTPISEFSIADAKDDDSISDDLIDKFKQTTTSTSSRRNTGGDGKDPSTASVKVRKGKGHRKHYRVIDVPDLKEKLNNNDELLSNRRNLILFDETTDVSIKQCINHLENGAAVARVPQYVYNELIDCDNVYASRDEYLADVDGIELAFADGSTAMSQDLDDDVCVVAISPEYLEMITENIEVDQHTAAMMYLKHLQEGNASRQVDGVNLDEYDVRLMTQKSQLEQLIIPSEFSPSVITDRYYRDIDYTKINTRYSIARDIVKDHVREQYDDSHEHFDYLFDNMDIDEIENVMSIADDLGMRIDE